ncbi:predicted protein [Chaetoceros tenuissimus]|uniref:SAP domain-containing protein n=1 Tax=Chaetoceros tenuissimus TaxID=426638 RepID=A0AAD3H605_9STRA|nr:predicted protein [Chaetoceros tenuissimus]
MTHLEEITNSPEKPQECREIGQFSPFNRKRKAETTEINDNSLKQSPPSTELSQHLTTDKENEQVNGISLSKERLQFEHNSKSFKNDAGTLSHDSNVESNCNATSLVDPVSSPPSQATTQDSSSIGSKPNAPTTAVNGYFPYPPTQAVNGYFPNAPTPLMGVPFVPPTPLMGVPFVPPTPLMGVPFVPTPLMGVPLVPTPLMGVPLVPTPFMGVDYSSLTVPALKDELRSRGLKVGGNKFELIARLQEFDLIARLQEYHQQHEEQVSGALSDILNREDTNGCFPLQQSEEEIKEAKRLKKNELQRERRRENKEKIKAIEQKPEETRTEKEETLLQAQKEKRLKDNERYHNKKEKYERICAKPKEERSEDEKTFVQQYEEQRDLKNEQARERWQERKDEYNEQKRERYQERKDEYERISEIPEEARSKEECMFMYEYKHYLELKSEYNKKRRREKGSLTIDEFEEESKKFTENVALSCPDPSQAPSTAEMITKYLKNKHDEENNENIKKNFLARMLYENYNIFHFGVCPIEDMQKILTDEEEELDVIIPYLEFLAQFTTLPHVDHLDPHHVIHQRGISAATSELYSWWLQRFLESIRVGLNHAFVRDNIQQLKGAKVYMFGKHEPEEEWGIRFIRAANHHLQNMQNFVITRDPVIPDFVLEITFGATGFFDPHTTIDLIRINGQECELRIWGPP